MTSDPPPVRRDSLRTRLLRSHVGVMVLGVVVFVVVAAVVGVIVSEAGPRGGRSAGGRAFLAIIVAGGVAVGVSATVMARVAARRITAPIEAVAAATQRMAKGNYAVRVPLSDTAELAALANDVNVLAAELDAMEERRLRLIGDVAHELRTPLQTIEGSMEALLDGVIEPTPEVFAAISDEAARLRRVAADLSSLSRAQDGDTRLRIEQMDLANAVHDVAGLLEHQFAAAGVALDVIGHGPILIRADQDRIAQILMNIVGNALAYTLEGGQVSIRVGVEDGQAAVTVTDDGIGIAAEDVERIFERFYRADERTGPGTGVGLTIARALARAHSGDVTAASEGRGKGATFKFVIPVGGAGSPSSR